MKISIGSDHRGLELKTKIIKIFRNVSWQDVGTASKEKTDYPIFAKKVCKDVLDGESERGVLICGSGVGMSIAANRFAKIYAALCWNVEVVEAAAQEDKANVLILPADFLDAKSAYQILNVWFNTEFRRGRYLKRLEMIDR